ncbi:MAG: Trk system potassium transporter TrkA [Clostridia bacterium]|nr:Trk system potassium transporter TrkA [Clostridia bacterium]
MKIIIVGGGKAGATLANALVSEEHDVTIIDYKAERIAALCNNNDMMGLVGNGMNYSALFDAGIEDTDLLISVTGSDEQNLLCCLFARKMEQCSTIARIRNPIYLKELAFIKEQVGLAMIINPEQAAANEISNLLRFPSAIEVNSFSKGQAEMLTFKIPEGSLLDGKTLIQVRSKLDTNVLFCIVERKGKAHIPYGNFTLQTGDKVTIMIHPKEATRFFRQINLDTHSVKNVIIVGGGMIAHYLAQQLLDSRIKVKIIERNEARCHELAELLPEALIIHGDASDKSLLLEEGITTTDAFVAVTGFDEENVLLSLYAKEMSDAKVVTKVDRQIFTELTDSLNLDSVIHPTDITAENILQYARAKQNAMGNNVETLYKLIENQVEALEFNVSENAPGLLGIPLKELQLKSNLLICGINRGRRFILPDGETTFQPGDRVIVVAEQARLNDFKDILK